MRRAERLFEIIQLLRQARRPLTAAAMAGELETSRRSVYRDIAALAAQGVPIRGEAGIGYVLDAGFDMPPLMLTTDEIEAAVLGAQWVAGHADPGLGRAARSLLTKIEAVVPAGQQPLFADAGVRTQPGWAIPPDAIDVARLRRAVRSGHKVAIRYADARGRESSRTIWPIVVGYLDDRRLLAGWCERREDFRDFRLDRVVDIEFLAERIPLRPAVLRQRWLASLEARRAGVRAADQP